MPYRLTQLAGLRVLITGGAGYLGRAVVRVAHEMGAEVHVVSRRLVHSDVAGGIRSWQADLADPAVTSSVVRSVRPDVVLHASGHSSAQRELAAVSPSVRDNVLATINLLTACAEVGSVRRIVHAGSIDSPVGSAQEVAPASAYAASKLVESIYGRMFHRTYGLNVVEARVAVVYGPGHQRPGKVIPTIISNLLAGRPAELSRGLRLADWTYIEDAAVGFVLCALGDDLAGRSVDVGTGSLVSVAEIARRIGDLMGRPDLIRLGVLPDRAGEPERPADALATQSKLNWTASVALEDGLRHTIDWYRQSEATRPAVPLLTTIPSVLARFGRTQRPSTDLASPVGA